MKITLIKKQTRPSVDVPFFFESQYVNKEYGPYLKKNYIDTGKLLTVDRAMAEDKLSMTMTTVWESQEAFAEYYADPFCIENFLKISAEYEQTHGIKSETFGDTGFVRPTWKQIKSEDYFKDIEIPDDWDTLEDFVDWYLNQRMPLMIPWDSQVIKSDDAAAICLFRKGHYQVEFYIIYPNMYIYKHAHPRMEVITMTMGGGGTWEPVPNSTTNTSHTWGGLTVKLVNGNYHGGDADAATGNGFVILAFERWDDPAEMTSAAKQWKGALQGDIQVETIRQQYPDAYIIDGYADITRDSSGNHIS